MDVHPTKNGIFIGIDPSPHTKPMPVLHRPQCQVQCGEASVEEDRRRILHAICGSDGAPSQELRPSEVLTMQVTQPAMKMGDI